MNELALFEVFSVPWDQGLLVRQVAPLSQVDLDLPRNKEDFRSLRK